MSDFAITCDELPNEAALDELLQHLRDYNTGFVGPAEFKRFLLTVRDRGGELVGGLEGEFAWTWLHVSYLWVTEERRRSGIGAALLDTAERRASAPLRRQLSRYIRIPGAWLL